MEVLAFTVINKEIGSDIKQVVGDNDYQASFLLDEEWDDKEVICRVVWNNTTSLDIKLEDLSCVIPAYIMKRGEVSIGVYVDGDEQLTTSPWKIGVVKSIREKEFETAVPHKAVWDGINEKVKDVVTHSEFDEQVGVKVNAYLPKYFSRKVNVCECTTTEGRSAASTKRYGFGYKIAKGNIISSVTFNSTRSGVSVNIEIWELEADVLTSVKKVTVNSEAGFVTVDLDYTTNNEAYITLQCDTAGVTTFQNPKTDMYMIAISDNTVSEYAMSSVSTLVNMALIGYITLQEKINVFNMQEDIAEIKNKKTLEVGKDKTYQTITEACAMASDGDTILIHDGTYKEQLHLNGKELHLIGTNKKTCIIYDDSADYRTPPITMNIGSVQNLTIIEDASNPAEGLEDVMIGNSFPALNMAYCVHIDSETNVGGKDMLVSNCILKNANRPCLGIGLWENYSVRIENCTLESGVHAENTTERGALYFHNCNTDNIENQSISVRNCDIICDDNYSVYMGNIKSNGSCNIEFINNMIYSKVNKKTDSAVSGTFTETTFELSDRSYGNNIDKLNA